jgi:hypothetical protein
MNSRVARIWLKIAAFAVASFAPDAIAREPAIGITPAGQAILISKLALDDPLKPLTFPLPMCAFPGGLCGAVRRDGTVVVPPRYDWVDAFSEDRAAVRVGGLYGFVDEDGKEVVPPHYRIAAGYKFGFAQVDVDGKSGLIDRDGNMVIAPRHGSIDPIAADRFRVSELRRPGGYIGAENFSGMTRELLGAGSIRFSGPFSPDAAGSGIIDRTGQWIEPPGTRAFNHDDPLVRLVLKDKLWGLARVDGSWLVEPQFDQVDALSDSLARARLNGKTGFIDRTGRFVIAPVFDTAWAFQPGFLLTSAQEGGAFGVIDRTGARVFRTDAKQLHLAVSYGTDRGPPFGWHVQKDGGWGLLDLDGRVILDAEFDQRIQRCADGRLVAYRNKEWLYFKSDGTPLQPPNGRLVDASCGSGPPYVLRIGEKFGLADADGKPVTPVTFDALTTASKGTWNAKVDGK